MRVEGGKQGRAGAKHAGWLKTTRYTLLGWGLSCWIVRRRLVECCRGKEKDGEDGRDVASCLGQKLEPDHGQSPDSKTGHSSHPLSRYLFHPLTTSPRSWITRPSSPTPDSSATSGSSRCRAYSPCQCTRETLPHSSSATTLLVFEAPFGVPGPTLRSTLGL